MSVSEIFLGAARAHPILSVIISPLVLFVIRSVYRIFFHPLSHIPGPVLPKITSLWLHYHAYVGDEASSIRALHATYGAFVRVYVEYLQKITAYANGEARLMRSI